MFGDLVRLYYSDERYKNIDIAARINSLLCELSRTDASGKLQNIIVSNVISLINDSPNKFFTIEELAESQFCCAKTLSSLFRSCTGSTIHKYQTELKMKMARELFRTNPEIKLKELAEHFGFSDEYHFCKTYKKYYGMTPKRVNYNIKKSARTSQLLK